MIPYRLLPPAEEEMIEAALFYEGEAAGLGDDFLDDVQHAIDSVREHPELGTSVGPWLPPCARAPLSVQHHLCK